MGQSPACNSICVFGQVQGFSYGLCFDRVSIPEPSVILPVLLILLLLPLLLLLLLGAVVGDCGSSCGGGGGAGADDGVPVVLVLWCCCWCWCQRCCSCCSEIGYSTWCLSWAGPQIRHWRRLLVPCMQTDPVQVDLNRIAMSMLARGLIMAHMSRPQLSKQSV